MPRTLSTVDRELLAQVVEVSTDAIFTEDLSGRLTSWNPGAEVLYGCLAADMIGRSASDLLPATTAAHLTHVRDAALSGEHVARFDTWHQRVDGRHLAVSVTVSPLRDADGRIAGLATSVQDVTERVRLSAALEDAHRTLEKQHAALRRSNRDLEQFAYVASHDLSEPLRVMTGYVQLIEKRYAALLDDKGRRYVFHVVDGAQRMRTLIDDLLEYSRFLRTEGTTAAVDTAALARRVVAGLDDLPSAARVEVRDVPAVWADAGAVTAVLSNLISNALKFTRPDVAPHVVVSGRESQGWVQVDVDDDGIGIASDYRERVFRMFQRLHVREAYSGTGIGLAIVQQVAESHGGRAWVGDSPLGGCRFSFTLPAAPALLGDRPCS